MTPTELINSGILEAYILGAASSAEEALVGTLANDPAVHTVLSELAEMLERLARENKLTPPPFLPARSKDQF